MRQGKWGHVQMLRQEAILSGLRCASLAAKLMRVGCKRIRDSGAREGPRFSSLLLSVSSRSFPFAAAAVHFVLRSPCSPSCHVWSLAAPAAAAARAVYGFGLLVFRLDPAPALQA